MGEATLRGYLFGDASEGDSADAIARSLRERGPARTAMYGIERLGAGALAVVDKEVAGVAAGLLRYDLGDLLIDGWTTYSQLMDAAKRSVAQPGQKEIVELGAHTVTWTYEPKVEVVVDGTVAKTLHFVLTVDFKLQPLVLEVRDGYLEALKTGGGEVVAALTLEGRPVLPKRETPIDDFATLLPLRQPVRLVAPSTGRSDAV